MRKVLFVVCVMCAVLAYAQEKKELTIAEPDFLGECLLVDGDEGVTLDKEFCKVKKSKKIGWSTIGLKKAKTQIEIKKNAAQTRVPAKEFQLIVRATDNKYDPFTIVKIVKLEVEKKKRKTEITEEDSTGGMDESEQEFMKYSAKKYGNASYLLTIKNPEEGEYAVIVGNPKAKDLTSIVVSCFGVDEAEE